MANGEWKTAETGFPVRGSTGGHAEPWTSASGPASERSETSRSARGWDPARLEKSSSRREASASVRRGGGALAAHAAGWEMENGKSKTADARAGR